MMHELRSDRAASRAVAAAGRGNVRRIAAISAKLDPSTQIRRRSPFSKQTCGAEYASHSRAGALRDRVEDRLKIRRRPANDPQDLAGGRLLVERFGHLRWACGRVSPAIP